MYIESMIEIVMLWKLQRHHSVKLFDGCGDELVVVF